MKATKVLLVLFTALMILSGNAFAKTVSIPAMTGEVGKTYDIPVNIDNASSVAGYQFTVKYSSSVLNCTTALNGSLTGAWETPTVNATVAGEIVTLAMHPTLTELTGGSGSLALLRCTVKTSGSTTLHFVPNPDTLLINGNADLVPATYKDGSFTIGAASAAPTLGKLTPTPITTEQGRAQKFTAVYSDTDGYANLKIVEFLVTPSGGMSGSIRAAYNRSLNKLYLYNDAGTQYLAQNCAPGQTIKLSNSQGSLNCSSTKPTTSGNNLTLNWSVTPKAVFKGVKQMMMKATDADGNVAAFANKGKWTIIATNTKPVLGTLTPSTWTSTAGTAKTFTAVYTDADGASNLKSAELLVTTSGPTTNAIRVQYNRTLKKLYLYGNDGVTSVGSCRPGQATTLSNTQGSLNCSVTKVSESGQNLTVQWNIRPKTAFKGVKQMQMKVTDNSNASVGWLKKGSWTIE